MRGRQIDSPRHLLAYTSKEVRLEEIDGFAQQISAEAAILVSMSLFRYFWAFSNTLVGLIFVPPVLLGGGRIQRVRGVLELHGRVASFLLRHLVPLHGGAAAITFGHVVVACDSPALEATREHERVHVRQCEIWGPLFMPAYLIAALWGWLSYGCAYRGNYFERQARRESCCRAGLEEARR